MEHMQILDMIERGVISADEGEQLLRALEGAAGTADSAPPDSETDPEAESQDPGSTEAPPIKEETIEFGDARPPGSNFEAHIASWKRWWMIPLWVGVGITILGGLLMFWAYQASGFSFWFGCAWLPFLLGVAVMAMAWSSQTARWLHLRVQQKPGEWPQTIAFSFPLPLRLAAWLVRTFGRYIPQLDKTGVDELILALGKTTGPDTPFFVEVDEGEQGEHVQIYIG
jgi:hypothetical protein